jgi:hypothetical protein
MNKDIYLSFSNLNKVVKYNLIGTDANHFNQKENGKDYLESIDCKFFFLIELFLYLCRFCIKFSFTYRYK